MGIDTDRFCPAPPDPGLVGQVGIRGGDRVVLYVGRFSEEKGVLGLIEAARDLGPGVRVLLVGDGPQAREVHARIEALGLTESVRVLPPVRYAEVHLWHRLADVFVLPSETRTGAAEQFGYALAEAMATGTAVVARATGGVPDLVGDAGRLVAGDSPAALRDAIRTLLTDAPLRIKLGGLARTRAVETYSTRVVAESLRQIYREAIGP
jgi:glycosyltransferase involved in cell wall biosynthesis